MTSGLNRLYPDITTLKLEEDSSKNTSPQKRSQTLSLPQHLWNEVRPNPIFISPEHNNFGKLSMLANFSQLKGLISTNSSHPTGSPSPRVFQSEQDSPNSTHAKASTSKPRGVKIEEVDDDEISYSPRADTRRSGPRKSEPLENTMSSLNLESFTPKRTKPRRSEPINISSSTMKSEPPPPIHDPCTSPTNSFNILRNNRETLNYSTGQAKLEYSDLILKPHQAYGRGWMAKLESQGRSGLIADEMGLGKTPLMLVRIVDSLLERRSQGEPMAPTLIVCPTSILLQWEEEAKRLIRPPGKLTCIVYHDSKRETNFQLKELTNADIVITSYGILRGDHQQTQTKGQGHGLFEVRWLRVVLDEAHEIRNPGAQKSEAAFAIASQASLKWCLTGTPLQNKILDLHPLFRFLDVDDQDLRIEKRFRGEIEGPIKSGGHQAVLAQRKLKIALAGMMLRRLKTDVVNGRPILDLPELIVCVRDIHLYDREREFYDALEARMHDILKNVLSQLKTKDFRFYSAAWTILLRLRQACLHANLLMKAVQQAANDAGVQKDTFSSKDDRCELCGNKDQSEKHKQACAKYIDMARSFRKGEASSKIDTMLDILREVRVRPGNEKTIIFSQFTSMLDIIGPFLDRNDINFVRLDGKMNPKQRKKAMDELRNNVSVTVILVSLMAGGTGLNLTECNNVIMFDLWWNPAVEEQAFGRAHRIGQTKQVYVYKLVTVNTVERRIMELQDQKKRLAAETLDRDEIENLQKLSAEQILQLIG